MTFDKMLLDETEGGARRSSSQSYIPQQAVWQASSHATLNEFN
jgi:hypothetical protein